MDVSAGFFQNAKSGSNYIRFLLYTTIQSNDSIKLQYTTDPNGAWTDSDFDLPEDLYDGANYSYVDLPGAIRIIGSRVHFVYVFVDGVLDPIGYAYSDDDGVTWTTDKAEGGEDGINLGPLAKSLDVFVLGGTPYGLLMNADNTKTVYIYDLTDFSEVYIRSFYWGTPGYIDGSDYIFSVHHGENESLILTFDGTNVTNEGMGFNPIGDPIGSILLKKENLQFLILASFGDTNDLTFIKYGNDPWIEFDFGGSNYDLKIGWEEDRYEPRFIHIGGNVNDLYYISEGGSLIKINENVTEIVVSGIGQFLHPYEITFEELDVYDSKLYEEHLKSSILTVESSSQLFTQGIGIVYRDLNSVKIFVGNVEIIDTDLDGQFVEFSTPVKDDLEREITVSFIAQKSSEILQYILDNKCRFLHGTIAATTNTFTIKWDNTKIKEIIQWAENEEFKIFYWDDEGDSTFDSGITGSTILNENLGDMTEIKIKDLGRKFNGILLRGGLKGDGTIARLLRSDQKTSGIQLNIFTVDVPQMIDDIDLPGHEMYNYGTQVLANLDSAFRNLRMTIIEKGHLQIGNRGIVTSQEYGISSENYTFFKNVYFPEEGNTKVDNSYNGLYFVVDAEKTLPESNREVLGQIAEELNNISQIGFIFYLDSNVSDVDGYKKMLSGYASDGKEDISVTGAVDGDLIEEFITEPNKPGITEFIGGIYSTHIHASKTTGIGTKDVAIYFEIYKRASGGTETLLGTSHPTDKFEGLDNLLNTHVHLEDKILLATDRILVKYYVSVTGNGAPPSIEFHIQGDTTSRFQFPFNIPTSTATDVNAIHGNVANEITVISPKTTPVSADEFILEDSESSFVKKAVTFANLKSAVQTTHLDTTAIHKAIAGEIVVIAEKTAPVGNDEVLIEDSQNSNNKKSVKLNNLGKGIDHQDTANRSSNDHHDKYTNANAVSAMGGIADGNPLHHDIADISGKLNIADIDDSPVLDELDQPISSNWAFYHKSNTVNLKHLTDLQLAALHDVVVAGDLDHDDIANPNANAEEQHMTSVEKGKIHDKYTNANAVTAMGAKGDGNPLHHNRAAEHPQSHTLASHSTKILSNLSDVGLNQSVAMRSANETSPNAYPHNGSEVEGELHWDENEEMLLRWSVRADAWIEIGGGAGLVGGNNIIQTMVEEIGNIGSSNQTWFPMIPIGIDDGGTTTMPNYSISYGARLENSNGTRYMIFKAFNPIIKGSYTFYVTGYRYSLTVATGTNHIDKSALYAVDEGSGLNTLHEDFVDYTTTEAWNTHIFAAEVIEASEKLILRFTCHTDTGFLVWGNVQIRGYYV